VTTPISTSLDLKSTARTCESVDIATYSYTYLS
jgi:hypothetical protein